MKPFRKMFQRLFPPSFRSHPHRVIIDITASCNLACVDCNRSCGKGQAPASEHMTPGQIRRFVAESRAQNRLWCGSAEPTVPEQNGMKIAGGNPFIEGLRVEGGEPTVHPQLFEILDILCAYKKDHAPETNLVLCTNGHGEPARRALDRMPPEITVINSAKAPAGDNSHCAFNMAPVDDPKFARHDFSGGCWLPAYYGIGLTRHGYYPHPICGSIDRVFGFDLGLKKLPPPNFFWKKHFRKLCALCGHYDRYSPAGPRQTTGLIDDRGRMSTSWQRAYNKYREKKPVLSLY
jgi:hypothetical protein